MVLCTKVHCTVKSEHSKKSSWQLYIFQMQIFGDVVWKLSAKGQNYTKRLLKVIYFHHSLQTTQKPSVIRDSAHVTLLKMPNQY